MCEDPVASLLTLWLSGNYTASLSPVLLVEPTLNKLLSEKHAERVDIAFKSANGWEDLIQKKKSTYGDLFTFFFSPRGHMCSLEKERDFEGK